MQNPLANFIGVFSLVRDVRGFQVNPLCHHDITSPFPPSGNGGYVRNLDDICLILPCMHYLLFAGARVIYFYRVLHAGSQSDVFPIW